MILASPILAVWRFEIPDGLDVVVSISGTRERLSWDHMLVHGRVIDVRASEPAAGYRASDLVLWPNSAVSSILPTRQLSGDKLPFGATKHQGRI
jgi:hypothetical protein